MSEEIEQALQNKLVNMEHNQSALVAENNQLRQSIQDIQKTSGPLIFKKMLDVKKDLGSIGKDQKNAGQGWNFRGIDQFVNALHPILNKHGVGIYTTTRQASEAKFVTNEKTGRTTKNTAIIMEYTFFAEDGSTISSSMPAEGVDAGDKGTNKALSAALKYALIQTFCVPTEDMAEADRENSTVDGSSSTTKKVVKKVATSTTKAASSFRKPKVVQDVSGEL